MLRIACSRSHRWLLVHCVAEPPHDFFGKETNFDRLVIDTDVVPNGDASSVARKFNSDALAAMLDINDQFGSLMASRVRASARMGNSSRLG